MCSEGHLDVRTGSIWDLICMNKLLNDDHMLVEGIKLILGQNLVQ